MTGPHKVNWNYVIGLSLLLACYVDGDATHDSRRLYDNLMKGYNRLIRPVEHHSDTLLVKLGLRLSQLLDVDLKNQIMTTNVWLRHEWKDHGLKWDPAEYNDIQTIHVPSENIWLPDVVLYNNADGNYEVTLMTKALLHYTGLVVWEPPAIYKSSCNIDVEFFPFDQQECILNFGSWTYDGSQVDLKHFLQGSLNISDEQRIDCAIVLTDFYPSAEWDIMGVPARKTNKRIHCCENNYPHMTFNVTIRRKALFYTVNLIIPCVSISFLTGLVFYLPSDSGEKITLCISILLSLTVFFLMLAEIIPPTSLVIPLLGKYLLFTMVLVTFSVIVTVIVLNIHYRTPSTHDLPDWARTVFLEFLPRMLLMQRPEDEGHGFTLQSSVKARTTCPCGAPLINETPGAVQLRNGFRPRPSVEITFENVYGKERARKHYRNIPQTIAEEDSEQTEPTSGNMFAAVRQSPALQQAIDGVRYIAKNLRETDEENRVCEDWKYIAMVVDRLFLYIFTAACIIGTFTIILRAPMLYDTRKPIFINENNFCNPMIGFNVTSYQ